MKHLGLVVILLGCASSAFGVAVAAPEIDANSAVSAIALVCGGLLVLRSRKN